MQGSADPWSLVPPSGDGLHERVFGPFRRDAVRAAFYRALHEYGIRALGEIALRGAGVGTLLIAYIVLELSIDPRLATEVLLKVVVREAGPLIATILLITRSGNPLAWSLDRNH